MILTTEYSKAPSSAPIGLRPSGLAFMRIALDRGSARWRYGVSGGPSKGLLCPNARHPSQEKACR